MLFGIVLLVTQTQTELYLSLGTTPSGKFKVSAPLFGLIIRLHYESREWSMQLKNLLLLGQSGFDLLKMSSLRLQYSLHHVVALIRCSITVSAAGLLLFTLLLLPRIHNIDSSKQNFFPFHPLLMLLCHLNCPCFPS